MRFFLIGCAAAVALTPMSFAQTQSFQKKETAILRALDKITGRSTDFKMIVGEPQIYGSLRIDLDVCFQTPPEEAPESAAFLRVTTATARRVQSMAVPRPLNDEERAVSEADDRDVRFSGWMFASSPGLSALEHPVYDIWVIACNAVDPNIVLPDPKEAVADIGAEPDVLPPESVEPEPAFPATTGE